LPEKPKATAIGEARSEARMRGRDGATERRILEDAEISSQSTAIHMAAL
jgi:hypothetical protein